MCIMQKYNSKVLGKKWILKPPKNIPLPEVTATTV